MGIALITMTMTPLLSYQGTKTKFNAKGTFENACYMYALGNLSPIHNLGMKLDVVTHEQDIYST